MINFDVNEIVNFENLKVKTLEKEHWGGFVAQRF